jgi:hypothetical protein
MTHAPQHLKPQNLFPTRPSAPPLKLNSSLNRQIKLQQRRQPFLLGERLYFAVTQCPHNNAYDTIHLFRAVVTDRVTLLARRQLFIRVFTFSTRVLHLGPHHLNSPHQVIFQSENKFVLPAVSFCDGRQLYC